jgi:2-C-methyl-D-erythritol 2,4-cyclodiphosphate synthase
LHRLVDGRPLVLAGLVLSSDRGPLGHSDGDVLCHSLVDAMLGAAGLGDIGRHFPNTDPRWKNAPGLDLLARAYAIVRGAGYLVANVDATVVLERPKLAPHIDDLRTRLAAVLGVPIDRVSVKAKTNEGVDAVGRGEAIAAHATALVWPEGGR